MNLRSSGRRDSSHMSSAPILLESLKIKSKQDKSKNQLCHQSPGYKFISTKARAEAAANPSQTRCVGLARHTLTKAATVEEAVIFPAMLPEAGGVRRGRYEGRNKLAVRPGLGRPGPQHPVPSTVCSSQHLPPRPTAGPPP